MWGIKKELPIKSHADQEEGEEGTLYLLHDFKSISYQEEGTLYLLHDFKSLSYQEDGVEVLYIC